MSLTIAREDGKTTPNAASSGIVNHIDEAYPHTKMPKISFLRDMPTLDVQKDTNLMQGLLQAGIPVASSCYGDGVCGKCKVEVIKGAENLSAPETVETLVKDRLNLPKNIRISCQTHVIGDVTIDATYW